MKLNWPPLLKVKPPVRQPESAVVKLPAKFEKLLEAGSVLPFLMRSIKPNGVFVKVC